MKIGFSKDIHKLIKGDYLLLGGVKIPSIYKIDSYSDGDCLTHSLIDAILGAAGLGDIGDLFSDTDLINKNRSSIGMLKIIKEMVDKDYIIGNIDVFISLESPKLKEYKNVIKENLAKELNIESKKINIKAGTNEGFDSVGKKMAIECYSVVLLEEKNV